MSSGGVTPGYRPATPAGVAEAARLFYTPCERSESASVVEGPWRGVHARLLSLRLTGSSAQRPLVGREHQDHDCTNAGSFDYARGLTPLRMTQSFFDAAPSSRKRPHPLLPLVSAMYPATASRMLLAVCALGETNFGWNHGNSPMRS